MEKTIGNTPMIGIYYRFQGKIQKLHAKLEHYNITGSIKDRMADYIINESTRLGFLKEEQPIIEATSGNTGIAFAAIGARTHHPVVIFMPDWVSTERVHLMESYGAKVFLISKEEGGFLRCIEKADQLALEIDGFRPNQFKNILNVETHYKTTGPEIYATCPSIRAFVSGIGTGGTLMGVGSYLKEQNPTIQIFALEPNEMAMLSNGKKGEHKIEGIGDDFIPDIVNPTKIDDIFLIHDQDAIRMSQRLASQLGIGVGISSGANFLAGVLSNERVGGNTVTIFPDDNKKYLSTDLLQKIETDQDFLSEQIELLSYEVLS